MKTRVLPTLVLFMLLTAVAARCETDIVTRAAADGSIIGALRVFDLMTGTTYPTGFSLYDKDNLPVFTNKLPPGFASSWSLVGFDGRVVVFDNGIASHAVLLFTLDANGFTLLGIVNGSLAKRCVYLEPSEIVIGIEQNPKRIVNVTFTAYDRKMKKVLWTLPGTMYPYWLGKDTVVWQDVWSNQVFVAKKGKVIARHNVPDAVDESFACGRDGSIVYWTYENYTNSPVTYATKKKVVAASTPLPMGNPQWKAYPMLNKKLFYVVAESGLLQQDVIAFSAGPTFTEVGRYTTDTVTDVGFDGGNVYTMSPSGLTTRVEVHDKKLSKALWQQTHPGKIEYLGKGVFCAINEQETTTDVLVFDKKGTVAQHQFIEP